MCRVPQVGHCDLVYTDLWPTLYKKTDFDLQVCPNLDT